MKSIALTLCGLHSWVALCSAKRNVYEVVSHPKKAGRNLHHLNNTTNEDSLSFDGNLDSLIAMAYDLARQGNGLEKEPNSTSSTPVISDPISSKIPTQSILEPLTSSPTFAPSSLKNDDSVSQVPVLFPNTTIKGTSVPSIKLTSAPVTPPVTSAPVTFSSNSPILGTLEPVTSAQTLMPSRTNNVASVNQVPSISNLASAPVTSAPITSPPVKAAPIVESVDDLEIPALPLTPSTATLTNSTSPNSVVNETFAPATYTPMFSTEPPHTAVPVPVEAENNNFMQSKAPQTLSPITLAPATSAPIMNVSNVNLAVRHTVLNCDIPFHSVDEIQYQYAIEFGENEDVQVLTATLEAGLNAYIASKLLPCAAVSNVRELEEKSLVEGRMLRQEIGIVALDSAPVDEIKDEAFCVSTKDNNVCEIVEGRLRVYFATLADPVYVHYKVLLEIRNYLNSVLLIDGLYTTKYRGPSILSPNIVNNGEGSMDDKFTVRSTMSIQSVTLFAFAGFALVFSIFLAVWFRNSREKSGQNAAPLSPDTTIFKKESLTTSNVDVSLLQVNTKDTQPAEDEEPLSPFSRLLPAAYRIENSDDDMSVILELNESNYSGKSPSIIISEGYSDDETNDDISLREINYLSINQAPILGAEKWKELENSLVDDLE